MLALASSSSLMLCMYGQAIVPTQIRQASQVPKRTGAHGPASSRLERGGLVMHLDRHEVTVGGREARLTPIEYKLLQALMEFPGRVFTREQLLAHVYAFDEAVVVDRTIDVQVGRLRRKLEDDPAHPRLILTVRLVGWATVTGGGAGAACGPGLSPQPVNAKASRTTSGRAAR